MYCFLNVRLNKHLSLPLSIQMMFFQLLKLVTSVINTGFSSLHSMLSPRCSSSATTTACHYHHHSSFHSLPYRVLPFYVLIVIVIYLSPNLWRQLVGRHMLSASCYHQFYFSFLPDQEMLIAEFGWREGIVSSDGSRDLSSLLIPHAIDSLPLYSADISDKLCWL